MGLRLGETAGLTMRGRGATSIIFERREEVGTGTGAGREGLAGSNRCCLGLTAGAGGTGAGEASHPPERNPNSFPARVGLGAASSFRPRRALGTGDRREMLDEMDPTERLAALLGERRAL